MKPSESALLVGGVMFVNSSLTNGALSVCWAAAGLMWAVVAAYRVVKNK